MPKRSAGLLMYRLTKSGLEVFLIRPGGPFWTKKTKDVWAIPKGEYDATEEPLSAALREFTEETGFTASGPFLPLGEITQKSGKVVTAWAFAGDCDPTQLVSNTCLIEWPPKSGRSLEIPEVEEGRWFTLAEARKNIRKAHEPLLDHLLQAI
jgi:predicted NUDIX family NTP pyrophosphohydrolase